VVVALWPFFKRGARLVYCSCSVFREEGEQRVAAFAAHNKGALLRPWPGHLMPQLRGKADALKDNLEGDHDGFHYAVLEKAAA
jgi:16S rRNA (cytosine967-C5)-methyltransferase